MQLQKTLHYTLKPVFIIFVSTFFTDYIFGGERGLGQRLSTSLIIGLFLGLIWWGTDRYKAQKK